MAKETGKEIRKYLERRFCRHVWLIEYGKGYYRKCEKCGKEQIRKRPKYKTI